MYISIIVVHVLISLSSKYFLLSVQFGSNRSKCALNLCFVYFVMSLGPSFASAEKCLLARQSTADGFEIFQNLTYEWQSDNVYVQQHSYVQFSLLKTKNLIPIRSSVWVIWNECECTRAACSLELWFLTLSSPLGCALTKKKVQRQAIGVKKVSTDSVFGALADVIEAKQQQQQQQTKICSTLLYIQMK